MTSAASQPKSHGRFGPYSRKLRRGAIRDSIDGRSATGRFIRDLERQLLDHVGGSPTVTQRLLIDRLIRCTIQLDQLDEKLLAGGWTDLDTRTHGGLINRQRLLAREIGIEAQQPAASAAAPTATDTMGEQTAQRALALLLKRQAETAA